MDHAQVLGDTPAKIADEKSGIMKEGRPAVVAYGQLNEVNEMLQQRANEKNCTVHWALPPEDVTTYASDFALKGDHQLLNLGVVLATVDVLREEGYKLEYENVIQGLRSVRWPGRLQTINWKGREILIDGAHNPDGGKVLKKYINSLMAGEKSEYDRVHWILGMLAHKDHSSFLKEVFGSRELWAQRIVTVPVKPNVAWLTSTSAAGLARNLLHRFDIEQLAKGESQGGVVFSQAKSVEEALDASVSLDSRTLVVLCGSLHLCGQVLGLLDKQSEKSPGSPEKSRLSNSKEDFKVLETMLWDSNSSYSLLNEHLDRMLRSAYFFGFKPFDKTELLKALTEREEQWRNQSKEENSNNNGSTLAMRVRLLLDEGGQAELQNAPFPIEERNRKRFSLAISPFPVHSDDTFLYHKTTNRKVYNDAWAQKGEADDVILYNEKGEVTETCIANIAIMTPSGTYVTPPLSSGLLGGLMRQKLLEEGIIEERVVTLENLTHSPSIKLFNSVRGMFDGYLLA